MSDDEDTLPLPGFRTVLKRPSGRATPTTVKTTRTTVKTTLFRKAEKKPAVLDGKLVSGNVERGPSKEDVAQILSSMASQAAQAKLKPCCYRHDGITVASACSGWGSELFALQRMEKRFTSCFACEIDTNVRTLFTKIHDHHKMYNDVRDPEFMSSPRSDFFFAGFPCQPFSMAGTRCGITDSVRGTVAFVLIEWIRLHRPKCFLLENVEGLYRQHKGTLALILELLVGITDSQGKSIYDVSWKILNTSTHGYIPQNRKRLFIAGVLRAAKRHPMVWPGEAFQYSNCCLCLEDSCAINSFTLKVQMHDINMYIEKDTVPVVNFPGRLPDSATCRENTLTALKQLRAQGEDPLRERYVIEVASSASRGPHAMKGVSPCLTSTRAKGGGHWLSWKQRFMTTAEMIGLMGVDAKMIPPDVVSECVLRGIAGNAVPVTLLQRVMEALFRSSGL